jgi:hypothetical protein
MLRKQYEFPVVALLLRTIGKKNDGYQSGATEWTLGITSNMPRSSATGQAARQCKQCFDAQVAQGVAGSPRHRESARAATPACGVLCISVIARALMHQAVKISVPLPVGKLISVIG